MAPNVFHFRYTFLTNFIFSQKLGVYGHMMYGKVVEQHELHYKRNPKICQLRYFLLLTTQKTNFTFVFLIRKEIDKSLYETFGSTIHSKSIPERIVFIGLELFELWLQRVSLRYPLLTYLILSQKLGVLAGYGVWQSCRGA